jgi:hypothetical protein
LKQVFIKGAAVVEDVPAPAAAPGEVLVRVANSCISVGTEMSGLQATSEPIWKRAARRPDKVLNAIKMLLTRGVDETVNARNPEKSGPHGKAASYLYWTVGNTLQDKFGPSDFRSRRDGFKKNNST